MMLLSINTILDRIFSGGFFKNTDTGALTRQYNILADLRNANSAGLADTQPFLQASTDIDNIPPGGIIINAAGTYRLTGDMSWDPAQAASAITITADDVTLDLKGHTLKVNVADITQNYNAISIKGCKRVSVQNGSVKGMSYYGVSATSVSHLQLKDIKVEGQRYKNTNTKNVTPCGIFLDKAFEFEVDNCIVNDMEVTAASCAGIQIIESLVGTVSDCRLSNLLNKDGAVQGFSYLVCADVKTHDCESAFFKSEYLGLTDTTGHTVLGFIPIFCVDLHYDDCRSVSMTGCCDDCHGMSVFLDAFVTVNNFTAKDVTDGVTPRNTGAKATGLEVYGIEVSINNCSVENIISIVPQDRQSTGFSACGSLIKFNNCSAKHVIVTNAQREPDTSFGYGAGYGWAPDPRTPFKDWAAHDVSYTDCNAKDCQLGFDTWFHTDSTWKNVSAEGCLIFILAEPDGTARTLSIDRCSESPSGKPETVTIYNIAANNTYPQ